MSSKKVKLVGALTIGPCTPGCCDPAGGGDFAMPLCVDMTATSAFPGFDRTINSPLAFVDLLAGTGFTALRFLLIKVSNGFVDVRYSTPAAADQLTRVSDLMVLFSRTLGTEITALAVQGTASLEVVIAS